MQFFGVCGRNTSRNVGACEAKPCQGGQGLAVLDLPERTGEGWRLAGEGWGVAPAINAGTGGRNAWDECVTR